jgi:hypothetical protein
MPDLSRATSLEQNRRKEPFNKSHPEIMSDTVPDETEWAEYSAARLKAVWVDFAEAPPPQRAQFLKEELLRAIKPVPGSYRQNYLERLRLKFPAPGVTMAAPAAPHIPAVQGTAVETASPEEFVKALLARVEGMPLEEKLEWVKQLEQLETSLPFPKPAPVAAVQPAANPQEREALEEALRNFAMLESLAWRIWREIAPQSPVKKEGDLRSEALEFLGGKTETLSQMKETMKKDRMLIGGLLAAVSGGSSKFATDFYDTFSPDNITAAVGPSANRCWLKYVDLARQDFPTGSALGFKIRKNLANFAENAMK